jgi:hypothetical protein
VGNPNHITTPPTPEWKEPKQQNTSKSNQHRTILYQSLLHILKYLCAFAEDGFVVCYFLVEGCIDK